MEELKGKVALVTGGSKGIGRAIALVYGAHGIAVALTYIKDKSSADEVVGAIEAKGGRALAIQADVSQEASVKKMVNSTRAAFGQIDILVNNAGMTMPKPWAEVTTDDWNAIIATNLTSAFLVTQELAADMVRRGWGRIIMLSSVAAQLGGAYFDSTSFIAPRTFVGVTAMEFTVRIGSESLSDRASRACGSVKPWVSAHGSSVLLP